MKFNRIQLTLIFLISLGVLGTSLVFFAGQAKAQDDIVLDITARLVEQGVPVKDGKATAVFLSRWKLLFRVPAAATRSRPTIHPLSTPSSEK